MSDATKEMRDFLTISPSVVFPDEVLELFEPIEAEVTVLKAENTKLRELVKNLHACNGSCPRCVELMGKCEYEEQLAEFGIEVD